MGKGEIHQGTLNQCMELEALLIWSLSNASVKGFRSAVQFKFLWECTEIKTARKTLYWNNTLQRGNFLGIPRVYWNGAPIVPKNYSSKGGMGKSANTPVTEKFQLSM